MRHVATLCILLSSCAGQQVKKSLYYGVTLWATLDDAFTAYVERRSEEIFQSKQDHRCGLDDPDPIPCAQADLEAAALEKVMEKWDEIAELVNSALAAGNEFDLQTAIKRAVSFLRELEVLK